MAQVGSAKGPEGGKTERKQVVLVPDSLYGAMFAGYTLPKVRKAFEAGKPDEWVMYAWFTLVVDRTNALLPQFSSALMNISCIIPEGLDYAVPKHFYNDESGFISGYTAFLYAMKGGKMTQQEIVDEAGDYDLDDFIGRPAIVYTKQGKRGKGDIVTQKVSQIQPADVGVQKAIKPLYDAKVIGFTEKGHLAFLESPKPVFVGEGQVLEGANSGEANDEDLIPF